jgi:hypothetical protein
MYSQIYSAIGYQHCPDQDRNDHPDIPVANHRKNKNSHCPYIGSMRGIKPERTSAFSVYKVYPTNKFRFMTGSESLENILEQMDGDLVAEKYKHSCKNQDNPDLFPELSPKKEKKKQIYRDPDDLIARPVHNKIPEAVMQPIQAEE